MVILLQEMKRISEELSLKIIRKALSRGGDYADIYTEVTRPLTIQLDDDKIEKLTSGIDSGVGVRVIHGDKSAYAYSNDFSEDSLMDIADTVSRAGEAGEREKQFTLDLTKAKPSVYFTIKYNPGDIETKKKVQILESANSAAKGVSSKIKQVSITYRDLIQDIFITTSEGFMTEEERIHTIAVIHVVAAEGEVLQTGYEPIGGFSGFEIFEANPPEQLAIKAAERAVAMLSARKAPGGRMPVIISAESGGTMIHEAIGHGLEADLVQQGLSVYAGKIGQQIASPLISVVDDSTLPNKRGSFGFDDEGVSSQRTVLVEKGILKGFMHSRMTAMKEGIPSTGNGRRQSYKYRPIPRMTNTFIDRGSGNPEEVIKSVSNGFFVRKMGGGQVNTVTGEFVFEVSQGHLIENGQVGELVRGATLIGNGPEILKSIDMLGDDLGFVIGTCGKDGQGVPVSDAMPTIRIPEMVVGGAV